MNLSTIFDIRPSLLLLILCSPDLRVEDEMGLHLELAKGEISLPGSVKIAGLQNERGLLPPDFNGALNAKMKKLSEYCKGKTGLEFIYEFKDRNYGRGRNWYSVEDKRDCFKVLLILLKEYHK